MSPGSGPAAEGRRRLRRNREYRPDLDLVAVGPDGRLAGFCLAFVYGEDNAVLGRRDGWVEQMGTHPDHRRRGIGRALLRAGLEGLRQRGAEVAYLETGAENGAAHPHRRGAPPTSGRAADAAPPDRRTITAPRAAAAGVWLPDGGSGSSGR